MFPNSIEVTISDPDQLRATQNDPHFHTLQSHPGPAAGHLFSPGEKARIVNMESLTELNGLEVSIAGIREDGPYGRAYYVEAEGLTLINWTYENRLEKIAA